MITVTEAATIVFTTVQPLPEETVQLTAATGRVLRQSLRADRDFPPFDRVMMDGLALRFAAVAAGQAAFSLEATVLAGQVPAPLQNLEAAVEVMTGAVLPPDTDTVVRYEDFEILTSQDQRLAKLNMLPAHLGQHVHGKGTDQLQGTELLKAGTVLGPAEIAVAATVGAAEVLVTRAPRVAVVSTGDELVPVDATPLPCQIRASNALMLRAAAQVAGAVVSLHHLPDEPTALEKALAILLQENDALVLSGGVSKGKADFLPAALQAAGVEQLFHEVRQRPGKPFWFGQHPVGAVVFALPGNPVSTFVGFYRYVAPWLRAVQQPEFQPNAMTKAWAVLTEAVTFRPALTYFLPVALHSAPDGRMMAQPVPGGNSGDLASLLRADGCLELPADQTEFPAGQAWPLWRFR